MNVVNARAIGIIAIAALTLAAAGAANAGQDQQGKRAQAKTAFTGKLPALDGRHLTATVLEVTQPPGGSSAVHRHPCPVIGYVLEGAVRMQVKGQEEKVYHPGDTFFESPGDVHAVSANVSQDQPARFLAFFVCDRETPLTLPVPAADAVKGASGR